MKPSISAASDPPLDRSDEHAVVSVDWAEERVLLEQVGVEEAQSEVKYELIGPASDPEALNTGSRLVSCKQDPESPRAREASPPSQVEDKLKTDGRAAMASRARHFEIILIGSGLSNGIGQGCDISILYDGTIYTVV